MYFSDVAGMWESGRTRTWTVEVEGLSVEESEGGVSMGPEQEDRIVIGLGLAFRGDDDEEASDEIGVCVYCPEPSTRERPGKAIWVGSMVEIGRAHV